MYQCILNVPLWNDWSKSNIFTSTWFSSAQRSFIPKFSVNFCDKIRRAHTVFGKIQNVGDPETF